MARRKQKQQVELGSTKLVGPKGSLTLRSISRHDYDRIVQAMHPANLSPIAVFAFTIRRGFFGTRVVGRSVVVAARAYRHIGAFEPHGTYTVRLPKDV